MAYYNSLKQFISGLTEDTIKGVIRMLVDVGMKVKSKEITAFIMNRYALIEE